MKPGAASRLGRELRTDGHIIVYKHNWDDHSDDPAQSKNHRA